MTTAAFDQSITDEINRRVAIYARQDMGAIVDGQPSHRLESSTSGSISGCGTEAHNLGTPKAGSTPAASTPDDIAPHIARIPLRSELRDLLHAAEIYDEQAARHAGEAAKCAELARCAREQAQNLVKCANL